MKLRRFAVVVLAVGLGIGCSPGTESPPSRLGLDTLRAALGERDDLERKYPGLEHVILQWAEGMPREEFMEQLRLFASEVMPAFPP